MTTLAIAKTDKVFEPEKDLGNLQGVGQVWVGKDLRLYRRTTSLMEVIAPCTPVKDSKPEVWLEKVQWEEFPPMNELKHLFDTFLSKYEREVMFVIGRKWDKSGWYYMVPKQEGTVGSIDWEDKEGMEQQFSPAARFVGTCHIHPGNSALPSGVDTNDWAKPDKTGLHIIFARDGSWTITGSAAGYTIQLLEGVLDKNEKAVEVPLHLSLDKPLDELLLKPKFTAYKGNWEHGVGFGGSRPRNSGRWGKRGRGRHNRDYRGQWTDHGTWIDDENATRENLFNFEEYEREQNERGGKLIVLDGDSKTDNDDVQWAFKLVNAFECKDGDLGNLRLVRYKNKVYIMTVKQYDRASNCIQNAPLNEAEVLPVPPAMQLRLTRKGGK